MSRQNRAIGSKKDREGDTSNGKNEDWTKLGLKGSKSGTAKTFGRSLDAVMRSPTAAEIKQATKNIKDGVEILGQIDREIEELRGKLDVLEKRRESIQEDLRLNRSIASKLREIPNEIFSIIFQFYIENDAAANPWVLMWVCRQWRTAAIQARRIWSKIMLTHAKPGSVGLHERRYCGYEICHTVPLLQKALDRAAGALLHISFNFGHYKGASVWGEADTISRQLVKTLQTSGAHLRIVELETKSSSIVWMKTTEFDGLELPALERAWVTMASHHLNARIQKTARRLRWLHLERSEDEEFDWSLLHMGHIDHLWLVGPSYSLEGSRSLFGSKTRNIIHNAPLLTRLELSCLKMPSLLGDGSLSILSLQDLELRRVEIECSLDLPNLRILAMNDAKISKSEASPLFLPSLESLTITNCETDDLRHIRAPVLHNLLLRFSSDTFLPETITDEGIIPEHLSPRVVRLEAQSVRAKSLSRFLGSMPLLEEFELEGSVVSPKDFFGCFVGRPKTKTSARKSPICTSLTKFKLKCPRGTVVSSEQANIKRFEQMIKARKRGRYPIKEAYYQG
ncbi:hypothetical protein FRC17_010434, partial [Serendipita sp. 399]